jgi:hypothetical protein
MQVFSSLSLSPQTKATASIMTANPIVYMATPETAFRVAPPVALSSPYRPSASFSRLVGAGRAGTEPEPVVGAAHWVEEAEAETAVWLQGAVPLKFQGPGGMAPDGAAAAADDDGRGTW